ncbi:hypothetical protein [Neolewinella agarilytica]|uniref:Uncharacterized protein n=1 Tax=Neolewinella agarilytica TaxID=478744 RepID=A0A1H9E269_9BACT|nr:hypothetical protein [Neolewinella agarilytica]SEQ19839.1 hypothetical protein SAMN05444359_106223 [Neolewinella agarilytica]
MTERKSGKEATTSEGQGNHSSLQANAAKTFSCTCVRANPHPEFLLYN